MNVLKQLAVPVLALSAMGSSLGGQDPLTEDDVRGIVQSVLDQESNGGGWEFGKKNRISIHSADGQFEFRIGGRVHQHWTAWSADDEFELAGEPLEDSAFMRRSRLYLSGKLYGNIHFKWEYDFAGGDVDTTDVYLELREYDFAKIRFGHFYEPFGLDTLTSDNDSTFVERNSGEGAEAPARNMGFMLHNEYQEGRGTWAIGAFRQTDGSASIENDGQFSYTGRVTYLPLDEDDGARLIHLGLGASYRNPEDGEVIYAVRPEARQASKVLDTGTLMVDGVQLYGLEFGGVLDAFSWQSEYILAMNDLETAGSDPDFNSWYAQVSYILTGEHRDYKRSKGAFGSVKPKKNFGDDGGYGAIEAALRYSMVDLDDGGIDGGTMGQVTIGANWYLNPNVRIMANVVLIDVDSIGGTTLDGEAEAFTMRFQVNF